MFRVAPLSWQQKSIRFRTHNNEDMDHSDKHNPLLYNVQPREAPALDLEDTDPRFLWKLDTRRDLRGVAECFLEPGSH